MNSILITGVSTGLGNHAANYFLERGWQVFGSVRNAEDASNLAHNKHFHKLIFDVTDQIAIQKAAEHAFFALTCLLVSVLTS